MITLTVDLRVRAGHLDPFLAAITENAARSVADEPGCLSFAVSQDLADELHFTFFEVYADEAGVAAHRAASHFAAWRRAADAHVEPGTQHNLLSHLLAHHTKEPS